MGVLVGTEGRDFHLRPYRDEPSASRPIRADKHRRGQRVLTWVTSREHCAAAGFFCSFFVLFFATFSAFFPCTTLLSDLLLGGREEKGKKRRRNGREKYFWVAVESRMGVTFLVSSPHPLPK